MPTLHLSRRVQHALTGLALLLVSYIIPAYPVGFALLAAATAAFYRVHAKRVRNEEWDEWYLEQFGALLREHERGSWEEAIATGDDGSTPTTRKRKRKANPALPGAPSTSGRRRKVQPALPGAFYFLLGAALSTLFFSTAVARTALLVLSIADPIAGVAGVWCSGRGWNITWKRLFCRIRGRDDTADEGPTVAGSAACAASTVVCTYLYIPSSGLSLSLGSRICVGVFTAFAESIAGRHLPLLGHVADDNLLIPLVAGGLICVLNENR
ncbi:hypothetical protein ACHAXT_003220 [Thalassiosira profunda]